MTPAIALQNVSVSFPTPNGGTKRVLDDLTLTCEPGEFLVLVGRSGCGKTTALNLLTGLIWPNQGQVSVLGKQPAQVRSDVGYMFARDALMPWRKARANVELGLEQQRIPRAERHRRAEEMLERVGLPDAGRLYPWQLSQGMRQRVALARTWAPSPSLLLMDEPFAALDAQTKITVRAEFMRVWEERRSAVVFVTHDLTEALLLGDRVVLLADGRIDTDIKVPFEHPRDVEELPYTPEFRDLEHQLWVRLR